MNIRVKTLELQRQSHVLLDKLAELVYSYKGPFLASP